MKCDNPQGHPSGSEIIVRDELSLNRIRQYIAQNPVNWSKDQDNSSIAEKQY